VDAAQVSVGYAHACIQLVDGTVRCWGSNQFGQLGTNMPGDSSTPVPVQNLSNAQAVAAGYQQSLALLTDGSVMVWGTRVTGYDSSTSTSTYTAYPIPSPIQNLSGVRNVATSRSTDRVCAIMQDGTVREWGFGTASNRAPTFSASPSTVSGLSGVSVVTMGSGFDCALGGGTVKCWGFGAEQELGNGSSNESWTDIPAPVTGFSATPLKMSSGDFHTCVVLSTGGVQCWGANSYAQLGSGMSPNDLFSTGNPLTAAGVTGADDVVAGEDTTCIILGTGAMRCWGTDIDGELGDGMSYNYTLSPVDVQGLGKEVTSASGGLYNNCAVLKNGSVKCWGQAIGDSTIFNTTATAVW
jgi:alpha-tubulin suppressor-like RCC1 family protein